MSTVRADVCDRRAIRRALRDVDRVFHIAGTTNLRLSRERAFALNVEGTRIVLEEALRAGVEQVVYTSSVAAIGPAIKRSTADERNIWDAARYAIPYVDSKHEAEVTALALFERGLPLVIVNPAHVLGAGDPGRSSTVLVRRFLRREIPAYVDGTLNVVGVEDVARGHLLADERGRLGERYILGNRNFTFDRLFTDLARLSGVERPALKLPLHCGAADGRDGAVGACRRSDAAAVRDPGRVAELGVLERQGQAGTRLADLAARGLPRGDDRLVSRARRRPAVAAWGAPADRAAGGGRVRSALAAGVEIVAYGSDH